MLLIGFPISSYAIRPRATTSYSKPIEFNIKLYKDYTTLWVKHATNQKLELSRAGSLLILDNTVNSNSIFTAK